MNSEDMIKFIESLNEEQRAQFEHVFKNIGESMGVEVKEEKQDISVNNSEDFRVTTTKTKKQLEKGRVPVRAKKNQWVDDGRFQLENDEEWSNTRKRIDRSRPKINKVEIECSVCGRTYMEHPNLIYGEYHRCNRCGGR